MNWTRVIYAKIFMALRRYCLNYRPIVEFITRTYSERKIAIMDYGCGYAQFSTSFAVGNATVHIYDKYPDRLHFNLKSIKRHGLIIVDELETDETSYDLIIIMGVLCLLDDADMDIELRLLKSKLSCDGYMIIQDLDYSKSVSRINILKERVFYKLGITKSEGAIQQRKATFYEDICHRHKLSIVEKLDLRDRFPFNFIHTNACYVMQRSARL